MREDDSDRGWPFEELFEAIRAAARADDGTARRSTASENGRVSVDFTVRTGLGPGAPGRKGHPTLGKQSSTTPDRPVQVDTEGGTARVTVDLTDTEPTPESVSATTSGSQLRVRVDGDTVATVSLGSGHGTWSVRETTLNNGIYQIRLE